MDFGLDHEEQFPGPGVRNPGQHQMGGTSNIARVSSKLVLDIRFIMVM